MHKEGYEEVLKLGFYLFVLHIMIFESSNPASERCQSTISLPALAGRWWPAFRYLLGSHLQMCRIKFGDDWVYDSCQNK